MTNEDERINRLLERARLLRMRQGHHGQPIPSATNLLQDLDLGLGSEVVLSRQRSRQRARVMYERRLRANR